MPLKPLLAETLVNAVVSAPLARFIATPVVFVTETSEAVRLPTLPPISAVPPVLLRFSPRTRFPDPKVMLLIPAPTVGRAPPVDGNVRLPAGGARPVMA